MVVSVLLRVLQTKQLDIFGIDSQPRVQDENSTRISFEHVAPQWAGIAYRSGIDDKRIIRRNERRCVTFKQNDRSDEPITRVVSVGR